MLYDSMSKWRQKASQTSSGQPQDSQTENRTAQNEEVLTTEKMKVFINKLSRELEKIPEDEPCFLTTMNLPTRWLEMIAGFFAKYVKQTNREFFFLVNEYWPEGGMLSEKDFAYVYVYDPQAILFDMLSAAAYVTEFSLSRDGFTFRIYQRDIIQLRRDAKNFREKDDKWWESSFDYGKMVSLLETSIQKEKWTEEGDVKCQIMRNLFEV